MEEDRLIQLLRGLPRETAPGRFTAQVLRRLDAPPPDARRTRRALPAWLEDTSPFRRPAGQRWHRLMVATATMAALAVSVGVSVSVLQRDRSALPLAAGLPPMLANAPESGHGSAAGAVTTASPMDRTFRHEGADDGTLPAVASVRRNAARPEGATLDAAQAHQLLRQLQLERGRLERELHSLSRPAGSSTVYLGGNDSFDLVLSNGRGRTQGPPTGDRDDGENYDYL